MAVKLHTVDQILCMHAYRDGTEQERLMLVFRDLARARAELAIHDLALMPHQRAMVAQGIKDLLDK